jgi:hypothetical protein
VCVSGGRGAGRNSSAKRKKLEAKKTVILPGKSPPSAARLVGRNYHSIGFLMKFRPSSVFNIIIRFMDYGVYNNTVQLCHY